MNDLFAAARLLLFLLPFVAVVHAIVTRRPRRDKQRQYEQELDRRVAEWKRQIRAGQERNSKKHLSQ